MIERKAFQNLPGEENPQFEKDGKEIYLMMKKKYPKKTCEDLDNILNGLCVSLMYLIIENVEKENRKNFIQLIYQILNKKL